MVSTLQNLDLLHYYEGEHIVLLTKKVLDRHARSVKNWKDKIDPALIQWIPKDWKIRGTY